jgi:hypothetical protein
MYRRKPGMSFSVESAHGRAFTEDIAGYTPSHQVLCVVTSTSRVYNSPRAHGSPLTPYLVDEVKLLLACLNAPQNLPVWGQAVSICNKLANPPPVSQPLPWTHCRKIRVVIFRLYAACVASEGEVSAQGAQKHVLLHQRRFMWPTTGREKGERGREREGGRERGGEGEREGGVGEQKREGERGREKNRGRPHLYIYSSSTWSVHVLSCRRNLGNDLASDGNCAFVERICVAAGRHENTSQGCSQHAGSRGCPSHVPAEHLSHHELAHPSASVWTTNQLRSDLGSPNTPNSSK